MKKLSYLLLVGLVSTLVLTGCSKEDASLGDDLGVEAIIPGVNDADTLKHKDEPEVEEVVEEEEVTEEEEIPEGCYRSELTNEWIDEALKDQRPIAVMVDNESKALPHFGVNDCDIVYEMINSTANDRITRLMVIMKDWKNIDRLGSVRSTRPTNFMVAAEYNAILIHDGGPFYNDQYYAKDYVNNLSGGFARILNGKASEFTEYVTSDSFTNTKGQTYDGLIARVEEAKYSETYNNHYSGNHFNFSDSDYSIADQNGAIEAKKVSLPFYHNKSMLTYNEETNEYEYSEYGEPHLDGETNKVLSFKNVIIQGVTHTQLDDNGYLIYNVIGSGKHGYYLTNGYAVPIMWSKGGEENQTDFISTATGENIVLNTGKTYIAIVPDDSWAKVSLN